VVLLGRLGIGGDRGPEERDDDRRTVGGEAFGDRRADPVVGAGHHSDV
jgi:hypothetical protein